MTFASAQEFTPPSLARSEYYRTSIAQAEQLNVYEGLPHQLHEAKLLRKELLRDDIIKFAGFPFYTPSVVAHSPEKLISVLGDNSSIKIYAGLKRCGAYHPDYCVSWKHGLRTYYALICYGCGEIVFYDGKKPLMYDLQPKALTQLKELLAPYKLKRPKK